MSLGQFQIPKDLVGYQYEKSDSGMYLVLTEEDITLNKETFDKNCDLMITNMERMKQEIPEYTNATGMEL